MFRRFSISFTLALMIIVMFVSVILIATTYSYLDSEKRLYESFDREKRSAEDLFNKSSIYIHSGLKLWASAYNADLYQNMNLFLEAYNQTHGHPEELNLSEIRDQFDPDIREIVDLYLINESGVIEYTTYPSEQNYNFSQLEEFYQDLQRIRTHDSFVPDEIVRGVLPGAPLRKFVYHPTYDHRYVAQVSMNVQNISIPERTRLSYGSLISYIIHQNTNLKSLHLFNSFGAISIGKEDYPRGVDNDTKTIVARVLSTHSNENVADLRNHTITSYIYIPHAVDQNPSSKFQDLVGKFVFSTMQVEGMRTSSLILHLLLGLFACIIAILIAWILSQRISVPITLMIQEIDRIADGDLNGEISPSRHPELDRIGDAVRVMISQIREHIKDMEASEVRYRSLFNSSSDAIIILHQDEIVDANPSAVTLFSPLTSRLVGKKAGEILSLIRILREDGVVNGTTLYDLLGRDNERDVSIIDSVGRERTYNTRVTQVHIGGDELIQVQIRDITKRYELEEAMKKMNIALEQEVLRRTKVLEDTIQELDAFTYTVSHDLRGPLRAIDGFAHLMESGANRENSDAKNYLRKIRDNIRKMGNLIEDLLRFSRASRQPLHITSIDCNAMVREVITDLTSSGIYSDVTVDIHVLPPVQGDSGLIRQVFVNLLSNAFKFKNPDWMNTITVYSLRKKDLTIYAIQDTGIGFDMEYADSIFDVFKKLLPESQFEGTGAGLAIVKRIISRHGGSIWAVSEKGKGSTFFFTFGEMPPS